MAVPDVDATATRVIMCTAGGYVKSDIEFFWGDLHLVGASRRPILRHVPHACQTPNKHRRLLR